MHSLYLRDTKCPFNIKTLPNKHFLNYFIVNSTYLQYSFMEVLTIPEHLSSPLFLVGFALLDLQFSVRYFVGRCLSLLFWSLCCLSFDLQIVITCGIFKLFLCIPMDSVGFTYRLDKLKHMASKHTIIKYCAVALHFRNLGLIKII